MHYETIASYDLYGDDPLLDKSLRGNDLKDTMTPLLEKDLDKQEISNTNYDKQLNRTQ